MVGKALILCAGVATAFQAPPKAASGAAALGSKSKSVPFLEAPEGLDGYVGGEKQFDPLGVSSWVPKDWLRESELKHGRVAMLATLGYVAADFVKLPGAVHQVSSLEAHDVAVASGAMTQILIWCGVAEAIGFLAILEMLNGESGRKPGEFKFDPLNFGGSDDASMQLKEIENGRLAMLAISGIVTQSALTGHSFPYV